MTADNGWDASTNAWIADMDAGGGLARTHVLDQPMRQRVTGFNPKSIIDIGCGEGRFCRRLGKDGYRVTGVEPTKGLYDAACGRDPNGTYINAFADNIPVEDASFDLAISYLVLLDIDDVGPAIDEMVRILRPGGRVLVANMNSFSSAGAWQTDADGKKRFVMDAYFQSREEWVSWRGIKVKNWHRPFSFYMELFISRGLRLTHFDEPKPTGGDEVRKTRFLRVPNFHIMEWQKE